MKPVLHLRDELLISRGDNRSCYVHPENSQRCIKVLHADTPAKVNRREQKYYEVLQKRGISWDRLAHYYGIEQTDQGPGLVFELVRDCDGSISKTVDFYLKLNDEKTNNDIVNQIELLKQYFLTEAIVFRDLIMLNLLMKKEAEQQYHLIVIDGVGHNDALPLCNFSRTVAERKIKRIWNRKMSKWFDPYPLIKDRILQYD